MTAALLEGITAEQVVTDRYAANVLRSSVAGDGAPVVFIHGNVSSSLFWQPTMLALNVPSLAIDLRGFGDSEAKPVDATRGVRDFSDDVASVLDSLGVAKAHLVGWSMGGGVVMQLLLDRPELVASLTLVSPVSPYGFGGTARDGSRLTEDGAGTGGGGGNPEFVRRLAEGDRGVDSLSPLGVFRSSYVAPGYSSPLEDVWVTSMLSTVTGIDNYPGSGRESASWPGFAAGDRGVLNTMSPVYFDVSGIVDVEPKPPVLWVRGTADAIVGDESFFDLNTLGKHGIIPGWPGEEIAPPQQMVAQTRDVFERYQAAGGQVTELAWEGVGHSAHLERPEEFVEVVTNHIA
ncbi:MAG TPA: alpha/beta fold hydrolase [Propionibacteriaceae bacterium]|nr:alpha/beta fold hydrolase [Propionibacteriaceae bacterium]HPZ49245.1 alpha/beta fold hydrolase [Propionibacteriaceae bacterium]HQE31276.1 alpha/beta fold hydrolase [Propionibacteriaceae bacterium]